MSEIANYFLYRNAEGETGLSANSIDDLNLDDLFAEIDYCHSSIGRNRQILIRAISLAPIPVLSFSRMDTME